MIALIDAGFMDKETYQNMLFMIASAIKKMPEWKEKEKLKAEFEEIKKNDSKENVIRFGFLINIFVKLFSPLKFAF